MPPTLGPGFPRPTRMSARRLGATGDHSVSFCARAQSLCARWRPEPPPARVTPGVRVNSMHPGLGRERRARGSPEPLGRACRALTTTGPFGANAGFHGVRACVARPPGPDEAPASRPSSRAPAGPYTLSVRPDSTASHRPTARSRSRSSSQPVRICQPPARFE
jgi:hypothetical protein